MQNIGTNRFKYFCIDNTHVRGKSWNSMFRVQKRRQRSSASNFCQQMFPHRSWLGWPQLLRNGADWKSQVPPWRTLWTHLANCGDCVEIATLPKRLAILFRLIFVPDYGRAMSSSDDVDERLPAWCTKGESSLEPIKQSCPTRMAEKHPRWLASLCYVHRHTNAACHLNILSPNPNISSQSCHSIEGRIYRLRSMGMSRLTSAFSLSKWHWLQSKRLEKSFQ